MQWRLAILVELTWGFIIVDTDGIGARLYPFVWRPGKFITVEQYAVIQALQVGLGILVGAYLMSWIAGTVRAAARDPGLGVPGRGVPLAVRACHEFLAAGRAVRAEPIGVGGIVATHAVYLSGADRSPGAGARCC